ncbi:DUF1902 domain-containing protein [Candidatus Kaiserbacteria bacterium]|nr:MAG: DUF1902 domain-containing protein [Candidatus Kaiserbacteria bacterium]
MKNIIQFQITEEDGYYIAEGVNVAIVTDAPTLDELAKNIKDAVALYFENEDYSTLGFGSAPSVLANFEISALTYA